MPFPSQIHIKENPLKPQLASPRKSPDVNGFSLLELVVVVAVLAILAQVAFSFFYGVTRDAKVSAAKSSLVNIMKECISTSIRIGREAKISSIISASSTFNPFGSRYGLNWGTGNCVNTSCDGYTYDTDMTSSQKITANSGCYKIAAKSTTDPVNGKHIGRYPHFMIEFSSTTNTVKKTCLIDGATTRYSPGDCDPNRTTNHW